jgi:Spy/CpxP family protein refolding chaperone
MIRRSVVMLAMLVMAGTALAQAPAPQWHGHRHGKDAAEWHQKMEQHRMERLALLLDLTPAQRQQVQTIFADERGKMKTAMQQVRQAMEEAHTTHEAVRKDAEKRLASVLSPLQMKKLKALMPDHGMMMHHMMMHHMMMHGMDHGMDSGMDMDPGMDMDHGMGPPPGAGPGPH